MDKEKGRVKVTSSMIYVAYPDGDADVVDLEHSRILSLNGNWGGGSRITVRDPDGETRGVGLPVGAPQLIRALGMDFRRVFPSSKIWINYGEVDVDRTLRNRAAAPGDVTVIRYKGVRGDGTASTSDYWDMKDAVRDIDGFHDLFSNEYPTVRDRVLFHFPWKSGVREIMIGDIRRLSSLDFGRTVNSMWTEVLERDEDGVETIRCPYYWVYELGMDTVLDMITESGRTLRKRRKGRKVVYEVEKR